MKRFVLALSLGFIVAGPVAAEMYRWVDKDGRVHYSERKPGTGAQVETIAPPKPEQSGVDMGTEAPTGTPAIEPPGSWSDLKQEQEKVGKEEKDWATQEIENQEKARVAQAERDTRCSDAKSRMAVMNQTPRMFTADESGNRKYLTDEERNGKLAEAQADIDRECG